MITCNGKTRATSRFEKAVIEVGGGSPDRAYTKEDLGEVLVKAVDGAFSGSYELTGLFERAGEGIHPGSEVVYRGVTVGHVASISLDGLQAKLTLDIEHGFKVPANAVATVKPKNLFGAEEVDLAFPGQPGGPSGGPVGQFLTDE